MNATLWPIETELANALPLSVVTLETGREQYRFHVFRPDEGTTHIVAFNRLEVDACDLSQLLDLIIEYEVIQTIVLAPVALEIVCRLAGMTVMPIYIDSQQQYRGDLSERQ
jgi:hypothetical protein